jgi:hypothetical protein
MYSSPKFIGTVIKNVAGRQPIRKKNKPRECKGFLLLRPKAKPSPFAHITVVLFGSFLRVYQLFSQCSGCVEYNAPPPYYSYYNMAALKTKEKQALLYPQCPLFWACCKSQPIQSGRLKRAILLQ